MKTIKQIFHTIILTLFISTCVFSLSSCVHNSIEKKVRELLNDDLHSSVEIIKLYHNEEKQGCFVEFQTSLYTDKAAINLDTDEIVYESEFDYWTARAEELRKQNPINEDELHKYNQKILNSVYAEWSFSVTIFEANGRPEDSNWERIK